MPRLTMLAPCDNVLIARETESLSLITVMTHIIFPALPGQDLPPGALVPMRWFFVCNWVFSPDEFGRMYKQRVEMTRDRATFLETEQEFAGQNGKLHSRVISGFNAIPIVDPGYYDFVVSLWDGPTESWIEASRYPLLVEHQVAAAVEQMVFPEEGQLLQ